MYDFPNTPNPGDTFAPPGGPTWRWNGSAWGQIPPPAVTGLPEAPIDANQYGRQAAAWTVIAPNPNWTTLSGKPATFPPTLPIAQADVTNLVSDLAGKAPTVHTHAQTDITGLTAALTAKLDTSAYTAADVLAKLITVDGSGSSLDADLLDGQSGTYYTAWANLTGAPSTFPPTLPIAQSDVTGLTAALALKADLTGATFTGKVTIPGSSGTTGAGLNIPNGVTPSPLVTGDIWANGQAVAIYIGSTVNSFAFLNATQTFNGQKTFSADLTVSKASVNVNVDKAASGEEGSIWLRTGTSKRWQIASNTVAESANAGSNFVIARYNDSGALVDTPLTIARATGNITASATVQTQGVLYARTANGMVAGGLLAFPMSSTGTFGIYYGSGAPTITAAQGSLYLRSDGSSNVTRMYVNTTGSTVWTAVNTVA